MDSSPEDRLDVILRIYETARDQLDADIAEASSDAEAKAIRSNLEQLKLNYLRAERASLEANGAAVEAAYQAANTAAENVAKAYQQGKALADRIRAVAGAVTAVTNLVANAAAVA